MGRKTISSMVLMGGLAFSATAVANEPSSAMLANNCAGCHGTDGVSAGPATPSIAGLTEDYMIESMVTYRSGERPSTIMGRIAKGHTDTEIERLAEFFAAKPYRLANQDADAAKAAQGKKLHDKYCEKCHEDGGRTSEDGGILAGQWMPYLRYSMEDFLSGARPMTKKMKRRVDEVVAKEGDAGIDALIHFYGSQK